MAEDAPEDTFKLTVRGGGKVEEYDSLTTKRGRQNADDHRQRPVQADPLGGGCSCRWRCSGRTRGPPRLTGGGAPAVAAPVRLTPQGLRGRLRRPHRVRWPRGDRQGHHGARPRPDGGLPEGHARLGGRAGRAAGHDRPLRAHGRPGRHPRPASGPQRPADQGVAAREGRLRLEVRRLCTGRGSRCSTRPRARTSSSPRAATWPASGAATTTPAACTRRPANEVVRGAISLELNITKNEHDLLNPDGINCIRSFPSRGIRVWGARTLSRDPAWRYLNVRRLFNYLEKSILNGTDWVVFEPNDHALWAKIRRTIASFLVKEWRKGALFGATPARGVLRQVRRRDQPGRRDRPRPGRLRDRRGPGQAGRVRHLPPVPVLRRHSLVEAANGHAGPTTTRGGNKAWPFPILTPESATRSASSSTASSSSRSRRFPA